MYITKYVHQVELQDKNLKLFLKARFRKVQLSGMAIIEADLEVDTTKLNYMLGSALIYS